MKKKLSEAVLLTGGILLFLIIFSYAYWNGGVVEDTVKVSVVLDSQNTERWNVLRQGMESFAKENDIEVKYVILTGKEDIREQMEILHREVQNGAKGIVLNLQNKAALVKRINESLNQMKVVMVDSELPLNFETGYIAADNKDMGRKLSEAALEDAAEGETFGVIIGNVNMKANRERLEGVREILGSRLTFTASGTVGIPVNLWEAADRILCLDAQAGEAALERAEEDGKILYTIGRTEKLVYYLDKGLVDTMIVADEFVMGYGALKNLYQQLRYYAEMKDEVIPYVIVNRENLYSEENERIMFPTVQ